MRFVFRQTALRIAGVTVRATEHDIRGGVHRVCIGRLVAFDASGGFPLYHVIGLIDAVLGRKLHISRLHGRHRNLRTEPCIRHRFQFWRLWFHDRRIFLRRRRRRGTERRILAVQPHDGQ